MAELPPSRYGAGYTASGAGQPPRPNPYIAAPSPRISAGQQPGYGSQPGPIQPRPHQPGPGSQPGPYQTGPGSQPGPYQTGPRVQVSGTPPPARQSRSATVVFGWVSIVAALLAVAGVVVGIVLVILIAAVVLLVGMIGALASASGHRGKVAAFCGLQLLGVLVVVGVASGVLGYRSASFVALAVVLVGVVLIVAGAAGVIVSGHRAPAVVASAGQPLGYTTDGEPFYPVVGYRSDGSPVTADQAPGFHGGGGQTNSMAITAFVLAFVFTPLAIPLGHVARSQIRRTGEQGAGLALAALIISYVWLGIVAVVLLVIAGNLA